jgi:hypothetical protein
MLIAGYGPGAQSSRRHICILHNCDQKVQVRKKNIQKNIVSVMENVLLILFCRDVLLIFRALWLAAEI